MAGRRGVPVLHAGGQLARHGRAALPGGVGLLARPGAARDAPGVAVLSWRPLDGGALTLSHSRTATGEFRGVGGARPASRGKCAAAPSAHSTPAKAECRRPGTRRLL